MRGQTEAEAFLNLRTIISEQRVLGGTGGIRGDYRCVCFSEAPETEFHQVVGRYRPFGLRVSKKWLFAQGGRPVIYQQAEEYELLSVAHRWRHVRYEPNAEPPIDFSWEREWRIKTDALTLPSEQVTIVVPHENYGYELEAEHYYHEEYRISWLKAAWAEFAVFETEQPFSYAWSVLPSLA
jgi:hypothetical protein